ncbi:helix-turn-helix domain-containing protein [Amycolatopsis eburnea]|uniref:XRE family transcriptional regulator n=1 Tax=Amycolatopsis eburnea TaxID=2267691 RepID=A0A427TG36_9PSEU|nr:helix-turn-helix transcriptional regulator [Amycolatopsis eburnea]RSD22024.1 XRE family transcriptional regulator [Amycolatopsis eburnea]
MTDSTRLLQFADRLCQLGKAAGLRNRDLAERTGWQTSKVSRLENGLQQLSEKDHPVWCDAVGVSDEVAAELLAEMKAIRLDEARWKARLRAAGHEGAQVQFGEAERKAKVILNFETGMVNGLLQTEAYARAMFTKMASLKGEGGDIDAAVAARMARQGILYVEGKKIVLLTCEAALREPIVPPAAMAVQLDRLVAATAQSNVQFGIVPLGVELPFTPLHGFWILDDLLNVELLHTEVNTRDPADVELYRGYLDAMWEVAAKGDEARALLLAVLSDVRGRE